MNPFTTLLQADARDERPAIGRDCQPLLVGWPERELFGRWGRSVVRESLAPYVKTAAGTGAEIHPLAIRRPPGKPAGRAWWSHLPPRRGASHGNQPAGKPCATV